VVGRAAPRKDALEKVTGKAKYSGDFMPAGMLHARLVRPPAHGAKFKDADTSAAEKTGARVVRDGETIAVLHERPDLADKALGLVKAQFERPAPTMDDKTIFDHLLKTAAPLQNAGSGGDLAEGEKTSSVMVEETYFNSYVAHAPMETHSATAVVENGKATVWASTQAPVSVGRVPPRRPWRRHGWLKPPASRYRWCGTAPRSSFTTPSGRRRW
jgi:CO/xanthine dehydrogenase Mo-binding subunit